MHRFTSLSSFPRTLRRTLILGLAAFLVSPLPFAQAATQDLSQGRPVVRPVATHGDNGRLSARSPLAAHTFSSPSAIPTLAASTYLGGTSVDHALDVAVDSAGNMYVTGSTMSDDFPGTSTNKGQADLFVAKLSGDGRTLLWSTIVGGSDTDEGDAIAVASDGSVWVTGGTDSTDFPTTPNAHKRTASGSRDTIVVKLDANGHVVYSSYYGYSTYDQGSDIAVDNAGNAYFTNAIPVDGEDYNIAVYKLTPTGSQTFGVEFGARRDDIAKGIAVDDAGNIYLTGVTGQNGFANNFPVTPNAVQPQCGSKSDNCSEDAFVAVMKADGKDLLYATYLGGSKNEEGESIAIDKEGNIAVTGSAASADFPTARAAQPTCPSGVNTGDLAGFCNYYDGFLTTINAASIHGGASKFGFSTFVGGPGKEDYDAPERVGMDSAGNIYVAGYTDSQHFPVKDALQPQPGGGQCAITKDRFCFDLFVMKYAPAGGAPIWSTYLGGDNDDYTGGLAMGANGDVYVAGYTTSSDFPVTDGAYQPERHPSDDGFVTRIGQGSTPPPPASNSVFLPLIQR